MGCCQDKDHQTSEERAKNEGTEGDKEDNEELDLDNTGRRRPKSNESLLITVLWRRLSMFSRRGSSRSNKRPSEPGYKPDSPGVQT